MKRIWKNSLLVGAILAIALSCKKQDLKKIAGFNWNPDLAVPIGYADFDVYDVLAHTDSSDIVIINPLNGEIALTYNAELASFDVSAFLQLDDYSEQFAISAGNLGAVAIPAFSGTLAYSTTEDVDFPMTNGVELHDMIFEDGTINLNITNNFRHDIDVTLTFPDIELGGNPVVRTMHIDWAGTVPNSASSTIDLTDAHVDFTANGTSVNRFRVDIDVTMTGTGQPVAGTESLSIDMGLNALEFRNALGYFGQQSIDTGGDTINIKLFNTNTTTGTFTLTNPTLTFTIDNSFGIPIDLHIDDLKSVNATDGTEYPLTGFPSTLSLNVPATPGGTATTELELNTSNTDNLDVIITPTPKYLTYDVSASLNPDGPTSNLNFVDRNSRFILKGELLLPLEGYAYGLTFTDTMDFTFSADADQVEEAMFRFNCDNGFPVSFDAQAIFVDENYAPLFSLFDAPERLIQAGVIDGTGKVISASQKITDILLDDDQIELLDRVKYVMIVGTAQTNEPQETVVKFFDTYKISVKLGMQLKLDVDL